MADDASAQKTQATKQPPALGGVIPYLSVSDASAAAEFYKRAFGAEEVARASMPGSDKIIHLHLYINGGSLMLADPCPEHGHPHREPQGYTLQLVVDDVDAWWQRAVDAGAEIVLPLQLMFWGDRYGQLRDPFGVTWAVSQPS